jgi:hypothetical protein
MVGWELFFPLVWGGIGKISRLLGFATVLATKMIAGFPALDAYLRG